MAAPRRRDAVQSTDAKERLEKRLEKLTPELDSEEIDRLEEDNEHPDPDGDEEDEEEYKRLEEMAFPEEPSVEITQGPSTKDRNLTKSGQQRASHYTVTATHEVEKRPMPIFDAKELGIGTFTPSTAMPEGYEAHLRIVSVRKGVDKNGNDYYQPLLEVLDEPQAKDFTAFLSIPSRDTMTEKRFRDSGFQLQEFMEGFGIPLDFMGDPVEEWPGYEAWNILGISENAEYGRQNRLGKFIHGA